ncbi:hypothetical protein ABPG74_007934 [Tetrahymena malaccensis]
MHHFSRHDFQKLCVQFEYFDILEEKSTHVLNYLLRMTSDQAFIVGIQATLHLKKISLKKKLINLIQRKSSPLIKLKNIYSLKFHEDGAISFNTSVNLKTITGSQNSDKYRDLQENFLEIKYFQNNLSQNKITKNFILKK